MSKLPLTVSLLQFDVEWERPDVNRARIDGLLRGHEGQADLLLLPEMFTTGFTMNAPAVAEPMDGATVSWLCEKSREIKADVAGSVVIEDTGRYYNRFIWASDGKVVGTYDKHHLFTLAGENRVYTAGNSKVTIEKKGWRIRPFICYDLRFPVWNRIDCDIDLLVYVASWPERRVNAWRQLLIARAIENQCYVAGLNRIGWDGNNLYHTGDSMVVHPLGDVMAAAKAESECIITASLDGVELERLRSDLPFLADADDFELKLS